MNDDTCEPADPCDHKDMQPPKSAVGNWTTYIGVHCKSAKTYGTKRLHGHHIVMKVKFPDVLLPVQRILCKWNINPYTGCLNLCIAQNWCHSRLYADRTKQMIEAADALATKTRDPVKIETALHQVALLFENCTFDPNRNSDDAIANADDE